MPVWREKAGVTTHDKISQAFCLHISIPNAPKKLRGKVYEQGYVCTFRSVRMYGSVGCFFLDRKRELNMSPFDTRTFNSLGEKECKSLAAIIIYMYTFIACVTLPPLPLPHTSLFSTCISLNSYQPLLLLTYPSPRILLSTPPPPPPPPPSPPSTTSHPLIIAHLLNLTGSVTFSNTRSAATVRYWARTAGTVAKANING